MELTGLELSRVYYLEVVAPALEDRWPGLPHGAARLGSGSDVLGLDDEMSQDHDWGLRLNLFVDARRVGEVGDHLFRVLPWSFRGRPTRFSTTWDPEMRHRVQVDSARDFATSRLGVDPTAGLSPTTWLSLTGQSVLEITAGEVFADSVGEITNIRRLLRWYPDDVWRYVVAADWARLAQELPGMGRAGQRGDDLGARVLAGRVVYVAMHLGFLLERAWPPYSKWLGTLFGRLPRAGPLAPVLQAVLGAATWQARQAAVETALTRLHDLQRSVGLPSPGSAVEPFYERPFVGVTADVVATLMESVTDETVRRLPAGVGSIEQWADNVDVLTRPGRRVAATSWLGGGSPAEQHP